MDRRGRIAIAAAALVVAGLTGWVALLLWVSSQGLFGNSEPAGAGEVLAGLVAFLLSLAALGCAATGRLRAAGALLVAPAIYGCGYLAAILL